MTAARAFDLYPGGAHSRPLPPQATDRAGPQPPRHDDRGASVLVPLLLRAVLAISAVWALVRALPTLPDWAAGLALAALGLAIGLPEAWGAAVRRGHGLRVLAPGGMLRGWLAGPALRVALAWAGGTVGATLLVLRLAEAGPALWALATLAVPLTWALTAALRPRLAAEAEGVHAQRLAQLWARLGAVGLLVAAAAVLGLAAPGPAPAPRAAPPAAAPLVAEALVLARLWTGVEAYALGQAAEFGGWGRGLAGLVAAAGLAGAFWAAASLAAALALPRREIGRALGPASDAVPPPPPGAAGAAAAAAAVVLAALGAGAAGAGLAGLPPEARPAARATVAAESIGGALHAAGTAERLAALRAAALADDAAARQRLAEALDAGFAAMETNIETFLDGYYSLRGEYGRMVGWALGGLEARLAADLTAALQAGAPLARFEAELAAATAAAEARAAGLAAAEAALRAETRLDGANPARLRLTAAHPAPPPLAAPTARLAADLAATPLRLGAAAGASAAAAILAERAVARLAARGLLAGAARMAARAGGLILAFGLDYALVRLDEAQNRDAFRAEIRAALAAQHLAARAALGLD